MTSIESYLSLLTAKAPLSHSRAQKNLPYITEKGPDIVLQAARLGSQVAYDAIVHAFVTSERRFDNVIRYLTHPAVLMMAASDKDSCFANRKVFHEALCVLMRFENATVNAVFNRDNSFIYEYGSELASYFPRLIYTHDINRDLEKLSWGNPNTTINQIIFILTWNFINSPVRKRPEREGRPYQQWFDPSILSYPFRLLRVNTTFQEIKTKLKYNMSRRLSIFRHGRIAFHESEVLDLRNSKEKIEDQIFLPQEIMLKLGYIMFEAHEQCFAFDWTQSGRMDHDNEWQINTPQELMEFKKDSNLALTKAGKHLCGFGIAVGMACEELIDALDLGPAKFDTTLDIEGVHTGDIWEDFLLHLKQIRRSSLYLEDKFPELLTYRDYYLNDAIFGNEPLLHIKG